MSHECDECVWVASESNIYATPEQKRKTDLGIFDYARLHYGLVSCENKIIELGLFTLPDWCGHSMFYLFECPECNSKVVDYPHGSYALRLECNCCGFRIYVNQKRFYHKARRTPPPSTWEKVKFSAQLFYRMRITKN